MSFIGGSTVLYTGQNDDEMTAYANTKVWILENLGDGWLRVRKDGGDEEEGYVPSQYVEIKQ